MLDIEALALIITQAREGQLADAAREHDRRSGLTALRPSIDYLTAHVEAPLAAAVAVLEPSGVSAKIERGWDEFANPKRATISITLQAAGDWPSGAQNARGKRTIIACSGDVLAVSSCAASDQTSFGDPIDCEAGGELATAVRHAVETFLEAAARPSTMQGSEVRGSGRGAR